LEALLKALINTNSKAWDLALLYVEFSYNMKTSKTTCLFPFKIAYGMEPLSPLDLSPRSLDEKPSVEASKRVKEIKHLHEQVRLKIEKSHASYQAQANKHKRRVVFQPRDLVWIHLGKERFPSKRTLKLMPRADGPFEVLMTVNDNSYKVNFSGHYRAFSHFQLGRFEPLPVDFKCKFSSTRRERWRAIHGTLP